jgi:hypothetical protein
MKSIKQLAFTLSLLIAHSTFCMERVTKTRRLDGNDNQMTQIKAADDLAPFRGKVIVYTSTNKELTLYAHRTKADAQVYYGIPARINKHGKTILFRCPSEPPREFYNASLSDSCLQKSSLSMRLLTIGEAQDWADAFKIGKVVYPNVMTAVGLSRSLKLDNLLESDRIKYFRNRVRKTFWKKQRILHLGKTDPGSTFYRVPRDMVRLIAQLVIDDLAQDLMKKTDSKAVLHLN